MANARAQGRPQAKTLALSQDIARDVDEKPVALLPAVDGRVVVLVFVASDCPISNRYLPELVRLRKTVTAEGVTFWFVYPNLTGAAATVRAHQRTYGASGDVLRDDPQELARLTGAKVTPKAAVLVRRGGVLQVVYAGRIDDRWDTGRQSIYRFAHPLFLPKGSVVHCGTRTTTPRRTLTIRARRRFGCGRATGRRMRWDICGCSCCRAARAAVAGRCCGRGWRAGCGKTLRLLPLGLVLDCKRFGSRNVVYKFSGMNASRRGRRMWATAATAQRQL